MVYSKNPRGNILLYCQLLDHLRQVDVLPLNYSYFNNSIFNIKYLPNNISSIFSMQFYCRPYMSLQHEPNPDDEVVWTAKIDIIRYNIMEMHHGDRVKLQFIMHQEIPTPPTSLGQWHLCVAFLATYVFSEDYFLLRWAKTLEVRFIVSWWQVISGCSLGIYDALHENRSMFSLRKALSCFLARSGRPIWIFTPLLRSPSRRMTSNSPSIMARRGLVGS